jgi:DNA-binding transcriptional LysR family regulator
MGPDNRTLDLEWIEDFLALAESGHFSRAAKIRLVAQPAFSRHIRSLEEWVGVDLVDRGAHPVELTDAGRRFLPLVRDVVASLEAARIKARLAQGDAAASLRFAVTHALSITFFPRWLGALETRLRHGAIQTLADHSRGCEDLMMQRRVQFVLCYGHAEVPGRLDDAGYPVVTLGSDALVPVTTPDAGQRPRHAIGVSEPLAVLDYSDASGLGRILRARKREIFGDPARGRPRDAVSLVFTAHNAFLLKTMALAGRGVAWLPASLVEAELTQGALVPAGDERWRVPVDIRLYRQNAGMTPTAEELWRVVGGDDRA